LKQQARQTEQEQTKAPYQPSRELLFASLFHEEFLHKIFSRYAESLDSSQNQNDIN
jgi:hypothetical protein